MDPSANIAEQVEVATELESALDSNDATSVVAQAKRLADVLALSERLAVLVLTLDEWRRKIEAEGVLCDECGVLIPEAEKGGLANKWHAPTCSLYDPTAN